MLGIANRLRIVKYHFDHWLFKWKTDKDGDIALVVANRIAFIKYKEHTIVRFVRGEQMTDARKWVEA